MTRAIIKAIILSIIIAVSDTSSSISASLFSLTQFKVVAVVHAFVVPSSPLSSLPLSSYQHASTSTTTSAATSTHDHKTRRIFHPIMMSSSSSSSDNNNDEEMKKEISNMRVKEIRNELESMNVSTKSFFEKSELVEALVNARKKKKEGPIVAKEDDDDDVPTSETTTTTDASDGGGSSSSSSASSGGSQQTVTNDSSSTSTSTTTSRKERIELEMANCKTLKVSELKKELEYTHGISTKSFFEKSEFVRAVAEARVDNHGVGNTKKKGGGGGGGAGGGNNNNSSRVVEEEMPRDPSFRDVVVSNFKGGKSLIGGNVIDVRAR